MQVVFKGTAPNLLSDDSSGLMVAGWKCGRSHVAGLTVGGTRRPCCTLRHLTHHRLLVEYFWPARGL